MQILGAACKCFADNGFHESTMQDICRAATLSPGAVYGYFSSKEEIIRAVAEEGLRQTGVLFDELKKMGNALDALTRLFDIVFVRCVPTDPTQAADMYRIRLALWAEAMRSPEILELLNESCESGVRDIEEIIRAGQEQGSVPTSLEPTGAAQLVLSMMEGFALQMAIDPTMDAARYCRSARSFLRCALSPHPYHSDRA